MCDSEFKHLLIELNKVGLITKFHCCGKHGLDESIGQTAECAYIAIDMKKSNITSVCINDYDLDGEKRLCIYWKRNI